MGRVKSGASGSSSRESRSGGDYASGSGSTSSDVKVKGLLNELHHLIHQVQVRQTIFSRVSDTVFSLKHVSNNRQ